MDKDIRQNELGITHDNILEVPKDIPKAELDKLPPDPDVVELTRQVKDEAIRLRREYGFIKLAPKEERDGYKQLRDDRRSTEKVYKDDMTKAYQEAYRRRMHNEELERLRRGETIKEEVEPVVKHHLDERTRLQAIICDFRTGLTEPDLTHRKVHAVDTMVLLVSRREIRPPREPTPTKEESCETMSEQVPMAKVEDIPLILGKPQCIFCAGNAQLPFADRMRSFKRVAHMMEHVETVHLRYETGGPKYHCRHPKCRPLGDFLISLNDFKNHVQTVHGIKLRL